MSPSIFWQDALLFCKVFKVLREDYELDVMYVLKKAELMFLLKVSYEGLEILCFRVFTHEHISKKFKVVNSVKGLYGGFKCIFVFILQFPNYVLYFFPVTVILIRHGVSENFNSCFWFPSALYDLDPQLWYLDHLLHYFDLHIGQFVLCLWLLYHKSMSLI